MQSYMKCCVRSATSQGGFRDSPSIITTSSARAQSGVSKCKVTALNAFFGVSLAHLRPSAQSSVVYGCQLSLRCLSGSGELSSHFQTSHDSLR